MRYSPIAAAALVLLVAPACAPVQAEAPWGTPDQGAAVEEPYEPEQAPDPSEYRDALGSYGDWHDVPDYGTVWVPTYSPGWQPYSDGYWAWTPYGWTWVSYEPWAWTLHYGRWAPVPVYGWVWIPGTVWGPAWVDWYWGDGYVGWAPLSPFGSVTVINHFVFVHERDFCSHNVRRHMFHGDHMPDRVRREWRERDFRRSPSRDRIERVARDTVTRFDDRPRQTLAPRLDRDDARAARPDDRPDGGAARRGWERREETRDARRETDGRAPQPAWPADDGDVRRRPAPRAPRLDGDDGAPPTREQPAVGARGGARIETGDRTPRFRQPRFDGDDAPIRPYAWGGRGGDAGTGRHPQTSAPSMRGGQPGHEGGARQGVAGGANGGMQPGGMQPGAAPGGR